MPAEHRIRGRWFRVLKPRYAHEPLSGRGAELTGGRLNRIGRPAFYLSADPLTAYAEYTASGYDKPGLMCSYDVDVGPIADLTDPEVCRELGIVQGDLARRWIDVPNAPTHLASDRLLDAGYAGALFPSIQHRDGVNMVLWIWRVPGATIRLVDRLSEAPTKPLAD